MGGSLRRLAAVSTIQSQVGGFTCQTFRALKPTPAAQCTNQLYTACSAEFCHLAAIIVGRYTSTKCASTPISVVLLVELLMCPSCSGKCSGRFADGSVRLQLTSDKEQRDLPDESLCLLSIVILGILSFYSLRICSLAMRSQLLTSLELCA